MRQLRSVKHVLGRSEFWLPVGGPSGGPSIEVLVMGPAMLIRGGLCLVSRNGGSVVCSVTQLYLDATVVGQELVVPHWDHSGNNLSIYLWNVWNTKCPGHECLVYKQ